MENEGKRPKKPEIYQIGKCAVDPLFLTKDTENIFSELLGGGVWVRIWWLMWLSDIYNGK